MLDFIFIIALLTLMALSNRHFTNRRRLSLFHRYILWALWAYHIAFCLLFYSYIRKYGGDSLAYWILTADVSQAGDSWMGHWGYRTLFIQWLNYVPSKILGLGFLSGSVLYANLSFLGFRELLAILVNQASFDREDWVGRAWIILLFLPGLHFWTAGVGKESLLWLGLIWTLRGTIDFPNHGKMACVGIFLSFVVRPINGAVLLSLTCLFILSYKKITHLVKFPLSVILFAVLGLFIVKIHQYTGIDKLTWKEVVDFSENQLLFLSSFNAGSELPMKDYSWPERFFTVLLRPLWPKTSSPWFWAAAMENTFILVTIVGGMTGYITKTRLWLPPFLLLGLGYALGLMGVYAITLNNLGIMMRMKSICTIFILLALWPGVYRLFKSRNCRFSS